ncbi:MAG: hypothetical protein RIS47_280 [Bacteroidota bacterium]
MQVKEFLSENLLVCGTIILLLVCLLALVVVLVCFRQAVGLADDSATWPSANVKCLPSVLTALQRVLPMGLARIAASSPQHVWGGLLHCRRIEKRWRPSVAVPVARTTAKSR